MLQFKTVIKHVTVLKLYHGKQFSNVNTVLRQILKDNNDKQWTALNCDNIQHTNYQNKCHLSAPVNPANLQM